MKDRLAKRISEIPFSATVGIADEAARLKRNGANVIDFSAGRAFEPTPQYISQAAIDAMNQGHTHQTLAAGIPEYREACAQKLLRENDIKADPETEIIATSGVKQGLIVSLLATINPGDEVIVEDPCFVSYLPLITLCGGKTVPVPIRAENNFRWTLEDLENSISPRTKAILFNSPQNPTGTVHAIEDLEVIKQIAVKYNLYVITDEVYERVTWGEHRHTCIATLPDMKDRTLTIMGLTKSFAMGGWRIGFALVPAHVMPAVLILQQHLLTCTNSFVQAGATMAFKDPPHEEVLDLWKQWEIRCAHMTSELNNIPGIQCSMPEGGFYAWLNIAGTGYSSNDLAAKLLSDVHVAVVPGISFGKTGEPYLRITCVKSMEELDEGLRRIKMVLN